MGKKDEIFINVYGGNKDRIEKYRNDPFVIDVFKAMTEYSKEFARFLLQNAMFQQHGKLYLKFTDQEIDQIIDNAMKEFEKE